MNEHGTFVALAYAVAFLTIGGVAARIILDYRRLKTELSRFGAKGRREAGQAEGGGAA
ncbi:heme exporter protein CcmD [Methylocystis sp. JAN1]|uniref:heme exporter protein CcmD n=1 Tax=Methylocystis sp. JAN1 TaxID=3397211 RepID=UPI003FA2DDB2